jgi:hypothetical protein
MPGGRRQALIHQVSYQTNTEKSSFFSFLRGFISHFANFLGPSAGTRLHNLLFDKMLDGPK